MEIKTTVIDFGDRQYKFEQGNLIIAFRWLERTHPAFEGHNWDVMGCWRKKEPHKRKRIVYGD